MAQIGRVLEIENITVIVQSLERDGTLNAECLFLDAPLDEGERVLIKRVLIGEYRKANRVELKEFVLSPMPTVSFIDSYLIDQPRVNLADWK